MHVEDRDFDHRIVFGTITYYFEIEKIEDNLRLVESVWKWLPVELSEIHFCNDNLLKVAVKTWLNFGRNLNFDYYDFWKPISTMVNQSKSIIAEAISLNGNVISDMA